MASADTAEDEPTVSSSALEVVRSTDAVSGPYTTLPSQHIRVLSLASDNVQEHAILSCNFIEQDLQQVIPWAGYNALSYVWGISPERVPIICNGYEILITRNLCNALAQIWKITPKQILWADAICINQQDDIEKGLQVGLMGEIYTTATTVLVWLGENEKMVARSWDRIQNGARQRVYPPGRVVHDDILEHPRFTRVWTLQEVFLARKAVLLCGTRWIDWRLVTDVVGPRGPLEVLRRCTEILQSGRHHDTRNLFKELLIVSSTRDATDPRDKIYALLGLMMRQYIKARPDYRSPYWQTIATFVRDQVRSHLDLWFLHACQTGLKSDRDFDWTDLPEWHGERPFWLPDLAEPLLLKLVSERYIVPTFSGLVLQQNHEQPFEGLLRVRGIMIGVYEIDAQTR